MSNFLRLDPKLGAEETEVKETRRVDFFSPCLLVCCPSLPRLVFSRGSLEQEDHEIGTCNSVSTGKDRVRRFRFRDPFPLRSYSNRDPDLVVDLVSHKQPSPFLPSHTRVPFRVVPTLSLSMDETPVGWGEVLGVCLLMGRDSDTHSHTRVPSLFPFSSPFPF